MENSKTERDRLVNEKWAADFLGLAVQTLRNRRFQGRAPDYIKLGKAVRYRLEDLERFIESSRIMRDS